MVSDYRGMYRALDCNEMKGDHGPRNRKNDGKTMKRKNIVRKIQGEE